MTGPSTFEPAQPESREFLATDEGFGDVLARQSRRRRRRRAALASASAAAMVVITIAVLSTLDIGTDSLRVVPTDPAATGAPGPTSSAAAPSGQPTAAATTTAHSTGTPRAVVAPTGAANTASTTAGSSSGRAPAPETISTTMRRSTVIYDNTQPCADTSGRVATGWCMQVRGPFTAPRGHETALVVALCRLPGTKARVHFPGTLEADFALQTSGQNSRFLWHYDAQHPNSAADHGYPVAGGTCLQWQTTWAVRSDNGSDIAPGDYQLEVVVDADNVAAPGDPFVRQDYAYTVT